MIIAFMSLVSALIAEPIGLTLALRLIVTSLLIGIASVVHWHLSEVDGNGDLRFCAAVQVYAVAILLLLLLLPSRYTRTVDLVWVGASYLPAKLLEATDRPICDLRHLVSGHTLNYLTPGLSGYFVLRMLSKRRPIEIPREATHAT